MTLGSLVRFLDHLVSSHPTGYVALLVGVVAGSIAFYLTCKGIHALFYGSQPANTSHSQISRDRTEEWRIVHQEKREDAAQRFLNTYYACDRCGGYFKRKDLNKVRRYIDDLPLPFEKGVFHVLWAILGRLARVTNLYCGNCLYLTNDAVRKAKKRRLKGF